MTYYLFNEHFGYVLTNDLSSSPAKYCTGPTEFSSAQAALDAIPDLEVEVLPDSVQRVINDALERGIPDATIAEALQRSYTRTIYVHINGQ